MATSTSIARRAQQKHWEVLGQISSMIGLCNHISAGAYTPQKTKFLVSKAKDILIQALERERENNQFINLNLPRGF